MAEVLKKLAGGATFFDGVHIFTPHADVPDDSALRLVVLPPEQFYSREETRLAFDAVLDYVRNNGTKPRYRGNRLHLPRPRSRRAGPAARLHPGRAGLGSIVEDVEGDAADTSTISKPNRPRRNCRPPRTCCRESPASATSGCSARCRTLATDRQADGRGVPAQHQRLGARQPRSSACAWTTSW